MSTPKSTEAAVKLAFLTAKLVFSGTVGDLSVQTLKRSMEKDHPKASEELKEMFGIVVEKPKDKKKP